MQAWAVSTPGPMATGPLRFVDLPDPQPGPGEVRVRVDVCGVCRTDLHLAEGDLAPHGAGTVPGHEVVGRVDEVGSGCERLQVGQRVGIAWLASTCGRCRFCRSGRENLCLAPQFTGWDRNGGFAEYALADESYVYELPDGFDDQTAAPLLCAGIIGYRALKRAALPPGGRLGLYGFGGSAHLAAQVALAQGATLSVMTRGARAQELARSLGAAFVGGPADMPPEPLDSAILFAPVGDLVLPAMAALDRGGTLAIAGIYLTDIPALSYDRHLFQERQLRSVTANTRADAREFLAFAAEHKLSVTTHDYPLDAADRALADLKAGAFDGAAVLIP